MSGLRRAELANLTWDEVLLIEGKLYFRGKGKKDRQVFIGSELVELLRRSKNGSRYVIKNTKTGEAMSPDAIYVTVKKIARRAGYPKMKTHDLRSIYAGWFLSLSNDQTSLQHQLGHSHISTTLECYTITTDKKRSGIANKMRLPS